MWLLYYTYNYLQFSTLSCEQSKTEVVDTEVDNNRIIVGTIALYVMDAKRQKVYGAQ